MHERLQSYVSHAARAGFTALSVPQGQYRREASEKAPPTDKPRSRRADRRRFLAYAPYRRDRSRLARSHAAHEKQGRPPEGRDAQGSHRIPHGPILSRASRPAAKATTPAPRRCCATHWSGASCEAWRTMTPRAARPRRVLCAVRPWCGAAAGRGFRHRSPRTACRPVR